MGLTPSTPSLSPRPPWFEPGTPSDLQQQCCAVPTRLQALPGYLSYYSELSFTSSQQNMTPPAYSADLRVRLTQHDGSQMSDLSVTASNYLSHHTSEGFSRNIYEDTKMRETRKKGPLK